MKDLAAKLSLVSLVILGATSVVDAQTLTLTTINGIAVPPDEVFVPEELFPLFTVEWTASASALTVQVFIDGVPLDCDGDSGGTSGFCEVPQVAGGCRHTVQLVGTFIPGGMKTSNAVAYWSTPFKTCSGACPTCAQTSVGRPVDVATGQMFHEMTDFRIAGPLPIEFVRRYDSQSTFDGPMGYGWQHSFLVRLQGGGTGREILVNQQARRIYFTKTSSGAWDENRIDHLTLAQPGSPAWQVADKHQTKWDFDSNGNLTKITDRNGNTLTMGYTGANLTTVTDTFGRVLTLAYYGTTPDRIHTISAGGRTVTYTYDATTHNLTHVDFPDASSVTYEYSDPNESAPKHNMTRALDSGSAVIEEHTYYGAGQDNDKVHTTQSDSGNYAHTLTYDSATQTTVANSFSNNTVFTIDSFKGVVTQSSGPECASCGGGGTTATLVYDNFLNLRSVTDGRSVITEMTYDGKGNVLTRKEAKGTPRERTWNYTWNSFGFPLTISIPSVGTCSNPNKVVTRTYDPTKGDKLTEQVTGCNDTSPFTYTTTWTYDAHGQVKTVTGPRTDVSYVTTFDYYADGDANPSNRGRLQDIKNALNQQTDFTGYDLFGNVGTVTEHNNPENVVTSYLYDGKDRTTEIRIHGTVSADDIVTENHYDLEGNLDFVRLPKCVDTGMSCAFSIDYVYDAVNRLKEVRDPLGNKLVYTYDTEGNRTREENRDAANVIQRFTNFAYDTFNRLRWVYYTNPMTPPGTVYEEYGYFNDGTRQTARDPEGHVTTFDYDELKRLKTATQTVSPDTLTTTYGYDVQDNLASVTDPTLLPTTYTNSDMGWRLRTVSADTGTTTQAYDPAGNLLTTQTANGSANGFAEARAYDALDRPTTITYTDSSLNVRNSYDSPLASFGVGRRTGLTDPSGTATFNYDRRGFLTKEMKAIGQRTYATQYEFDKNGNRTRVLYPTEEPALRQGEAVVGYDTADRVMSVTAKVNGVTTNVATGFAYKPFGPRTNMTFGNGLAETRSYGSRYQLGTWTVGSLLGYTHAFNNDLNLTSRTDDVDPDLTKDRLYGYDEIHRLKSASGPWGAGTACGGVTYTYDKNGNRFCRGEGVPATNYAYAPGTNRLASSSGGDATSYGYDSNGNTTGDGSHTYQYSQADRLARVDSGATASYTYDGDGRRVTKVSGGTTTTYFYEPSGQLLTETIAAAGTGVDYISLPEGPIARVDWTAVELDLGSVLRVNKNSPNVRLDWTLYTPGSFAFLVRRKQVINPNDKTFNVSSVIATVVDPASRTFDDPVLLDVNRYDYRVLRRSVSDLLFFYHTDHLGTSIAVTDGSAAPVWRAEHLPFGGIQTVSGMFTNNLRFAGQYFDGEDQLHYNLFRDYAPRTGRYFQGDPLGLDGGANIYRYAFANPVNEIDQWGLFTYNAPPPRTLPLHGDALALANCMEKCLGKPFVVTGGSECTPDGRHVPGGVRGSRHCTNQAFDIRPSGFDQGSVMCCAAGCGAGFAANEGDHWHFQTVPGRNKSAGLLSGSAQGCCPLPQKP